LQIDFTVNLWFNNAMGFWFSETANVKECIVLHQDEIILRKLAREYTIAAADERN